MDVQSQSFSPMTCPVRRRTGLTVAQVVVEAWRIEYNTYRPHSALGGLTPAEYSTSSASITPPARS